MSKKMFPLLLLGGGAVAMLAMSKKKTKKNGDGASDTLPGVDDGPAGVDDGNGDGSGKPIEDQMLTLAEHCDIHGGDLMILKSSDGSPSEVCMLDGTAYVMPIDNQGAIAQAASFKSLVKMHPSLNAGLWDGATAQDFANFGWGDSIVTGHRAALSFVVSKLNHADIEEFQKHWNNKHNDNMRTDGVIDKKTLDAINKSK